MNRRSFLKNVLGAGAAMLAAKLPRSGKVILEVAKPPAEWESSESLTTGFDPPDAFASWTETAEGWINLEVAHEPMTLEQLEDFETFYSAPGGGILWTDDGGTSWQETYIYAQPHTHEVDVRFDPMTQEQWSEGMDRFFAEAEATGKSVTAWMKANT